MPKIHSEIAFFEIIGSTLQVITIPQMSYYRNALVQPTSYADVTKKQTMHAYAYIIRIHL